MTLSDTEKLARLRLIRTESIGPATFARLIETCGTAEEALRRAPAMAKRGGAKRALKLCDEARILQEKAALEAAGGRFIFLGDELYPPLLAEISDAPPVLSFLGDPALLAYPSVAIVGARNASANGRRFTEMLSRHLSEDGYCIVSGLARGIDGAAHAAAAEGRTIAVVAGGVNHIYPPEHDKLHAFLAEKGGIIAEMPWSAVPKAQHFPRRNRIISGLCTVTLAIEAGRRSGSLITAKYAAEQGRNIGAAPGSPLDQRCAGTNDLIKQGATPVTGVDDVFELLKDAESLLREKELPLLQLMKGEGCAETADIYDTTEKNRKVIESLLSATPEDVDGLADMANLPIQIVSCIILEMELAGRIERHSGNKVSLVHKTGAFF